MVHRWIFGFNHMLRSRIKSVIVMSWILERLCFQEFTAPRFSNVKWCAWIYSSGAKRPHLAPKRRKQRTSRCSSATKFHVETDTFRILCSTHSSHFVCANLTMTFLQKTSHCNGDEQRCLSCSDANNVTECTMASIFDLDSWGLCI